MADIWRRRRRNRHFVQSRTHRRSGVRGFSVSPLNSNSPQVNCQTLWFRGSAVPSHWLHRHVWRPFKQNCLFASGQIRLCYRHPETRVFVKRAPHKVGDLHLVAFESEPAVVFWIFLDHISPYCINVGAALSWLKAEESMSRISIDVSDQGHRKLKALAALRGQSIKDFVLERALGGDDAETAALLPQAVFKTRC